MKRSAILAVAVTSFALSCKDSTAPKAGPPANIVLSGSVDPIGVAGQQTSVKPTVLVTDAQNRPVPGAMVIFSVLNGDGKLDAAVQTTSALGIAQVGWTLGNAFVMNRLRAEIPGLPGVDWKVKSIAPDTGIVAFDVADPAGDTLARPVGQTNPAIDLLRVRGDFKRDSLIITLTFAKPVRASNSDTFNSIGGEIEFDMDDDVTTGYGPPDSNIYGASANLGVDYVVNLFNSFSTGVLVFSKFGFTRALISYPGNSVVIRMPLSMVGDDDGNFSLAMNLGPFTWASDVFPNAGQLVTRRNGPSAAIVSSSIMFLKNSGREQPAWKPKNLSGW
jgi:hypothetical protein